jgi:hypothetical protein
MPQEKIKNAYKNRQKPAHISDAAGIINLCSISTLCLMM